MSLLNQYLDGIEYRAETFVASPNWKRKTVILCSLTMLLSFFNNLSPLKSFKTYYEEAIEKGAEVHIYKTVKDRASSFTTKFKYQEYTGLENRTFRLVAPVVVRVFGIERVSLVLYGLQLLAGLLFYYLLIGFIQELTGDRVVTLYAMLGISCIYLGSCFFIDNSGYGDLFSYLFLFLGIYFRKHPILILVFLQLAFWNDERAFVGSGLVFVWLWWFPQFKEDIKPKVKITWPMIAVIASWGLWYLGRFFLMKVVGLQATHNPGEFMVNTIGSFWSLGFRLLWQFEAWWLLFLLAGAILYSKKEYLSLAFISIASLTSILSAMIIYDSTRSGTFAFITIFFCIAIAKKYLTKKQLRWILLGIALLCFLHPLANKTHGIGFFLM